MKAIDLYSGVGGWSLGLQLAGIEVVASYEIWGPANETNFKNNRHQAQTIDIRRLTPQDLPQEVDIIVGSPPCTQFSYSNRGGNGDIQDGLRDIKKFLSFIDHIKPKFWAMENVPRAAKVILKELNEGGELDEFSHLSMEMHVINMEEFCLPQRRRRSIIGNLDFDLLKSYRDATERKTLGDVVSALSLPDIIDPIFDIRMSKDDLVDHEPEASLNSEEVRINKSNKTLHPVYNSMPFPDPLDRSVRTITATCTRVSRESVVIKFPVDHSSYRRLTVRERASLQGFPVNFQFYGNSYSQKLKMIGNAVPPVFSYYVGLSIQKIDKSKLPGIDLAAQKFNPPKPKPKKTVPDRPGRKYPPNRSFRFSIPSLRLKSGVRFELTNKGLNDQILWQVKFFFGTSKSIQSIDLDQTARNLALAGISNDAKAQILPLLTNLEILLRSADIRHMQDLWAHRGVGTTTAFMLLDQLDAAGEKIRSALKEFDCNTRDQVTKILKFQFGDRLDDVPGVPKLQKNSDLILSGILLGSTANLPLGNSNNQIHYSRAAL